jgi:hypothetical protein
MFISMDKIKTAFSNGKTAIILLYKEIKKKRN